MDEATQVKVALARRQLGTALALFLQDDDPVSVHCLACGGTELAAFLADQSDQTSFTEHALMTFPEMKTGELVSLRNKYWNAMKHARSRDGSLRDDQDLMDAFDDEKNDHVLFIGWHDYGLAVGVLPIEAQAFQAWYFSCYPDKVQVADRQKYIDLFPGIREADRTSRKKMLRRKIDWAKKQKHVMLDGKTERRKLVLDRKTVPQV